MPQSIHHVPSTNTPRPHWSRRTLLASGAASVGAVAFAGSAKASTPPDGSAATTTGFTSAEEAVAAYLAAMAGADFDGAVATFAIEQYVDRFDFTAHLEYIGFYQPYGNAQLLPNSDPFNTAINVSHRRAFVAGLVANQYLTLVGPEVDRGPEGVLLEDEAAVEEFVTSLETAMVSAPLADLATYEFVAAAEVDAEAAELLTDERAVENGERQLTVVGGDEAAEPTVRTTIGGRPVALLFRAVRYGESWWLETLYGQLARMLGIESLSPGVLWLDEVSEDSDSDSTSPDRIDPDGTSPDGTVTSSL